MNDFRATLLFGACALFAACSDATPTPPTPLTDLTGKWRATTPLAGYPDVMTWTIAQTGNAFFGTWDNSPAQAGAGRWGTIQGIFDRATDSLTFEFTWNVTAPHPYWLCWFNHDPLMAKGTGSLSQTSGLAVIEATYGDWTGCLNRVTLDPGKLFLVRLP